MFKLTHKLAAAFLAFHPILAVAEDPGNRKMPSIAELKEAIPSLEIWWARPKDEKWSKFSFLHLKEPQKALVKRAIKDSKADPDAGNFHLLEAPFAIENKDPQGLLIFASEDHKIFAAFRFRFKMTNRKSLEEVSILKCDFKEIAEFSSSMTLRGIELDTEVGQIIGN